MKKDTINSRKTKKNHEKCIRMKKKYRDNENWGM